MKEKKSKLFKSKSLSDTAKIAKDLAKSLQGGDVVALFGNLGAGKTAFVKELAKSYNIEDTITSPTFVLMKVYPISKGNAKEFVHVDCYRLDKGEDLSDIGLGEYMKAKDSIVVIEWAEKIKQLPDNTIKVKIEILKENSRQFEIEYGS